MDINSRKLTFLAVCYCWLSIIIFLFTWTRWYWAFPAAAAIVAGLYRYKRDLDAQDRRESLLVSKKMLVLVALAVFLWLIVSGSGGLIGQTRTGDWVKHNRILSDLIASDWPVYYHNGQEDAMLTYYVAQYLIPALFGKLVHAIPIAKVAIHSFRTAEMVMLLYNSIGVFLAVLLLFRLVKASTARKQAATVFIFVFFGTVLLLGKALYGATSMGSGELAENSHWITEQVLLQYPYNYSHLRYAFPQAITPWIATALFAESKEKYEHYLVIAAPLLLHATLPFLGIAILMIGYFGVSAVLSGKLLPYVKKAFSVPNLCAVWGGVLIPIIYLSGNFGSYKPSQAGFRFIIEYGSEITLYFCFCATFLCYSVVLFELYKKDRMFYLVNAFLMLLPFMKMGFWNDLCMRASIPATFLLMVFCIQGVFAYLGDKQKTGRAVVLVMLLCWGMFYPVYEMKNMFQYNPPGRDGTAWESMSQWAYREGPKSSAIASFNYYTYDYNQSVFYRYFARK